MKTLEERFWRRVNKSGANGCWEWTGWLSRPGYGGLSVGRKGDGSVPAHRASWEIHHGPIPKGLFVCHHCDNPRCVRPDHLFLGTQADNMRDMVEKGRSAKGDRHGRRKNPACVPRGERHHRASLTDAQVAEMRAIYAVGGVTIEELAERLKVRRGVIQCALSGRSWKHTFAEGDAEAHVVAARRNRHDRHPRGEGHPGSRLTLVQVEEMRVAYAAGGVTQRALAVRYNITQAAIWYILRGKNWKTAV